MTDIESSALQLLSHEVFPAKRPHEFILLRALLDDIRMPRSHVKSLFDRQDLPASEAHIDSTIDTLTLEGFTEADKKRYERGIVQREGDHALALNPAVAAAYQSSSAFSAAVDDLIETGLSITKKSLDHSQPFSPGRQYSRKEALRLLCWPRKWASTVYGYKVDVSTGPIPACPIFVTLHKSDDISASTAYEDTLLDQSSMLWYTRSRRTLSSGEVRPIVANQVKIYVFVKKDDAEGSDFYFLGEATSHNAEQTVMTKTGDSVVRMILRFDAPIETSLFDYFHPAIVTPAPR